MTESEQTEILLSQAATGDKSAVAKLLAIYRGKVRRMVAVRMDRRLSARIDPSDVVQETLVTAIRQLPEFINKRPIAFYPWLRAIAANRLVDLHRRHLVAQKRSVKREEDMYQQFLPAESRMDLARILIHPGSSPSRQMEKADFEKRTNDALSNLSPDDREVLVLKYLEELSASEIAAILNITERTVWRRHARAIEQLSVVLNPDSSGRRRP